MARLTVSPTCWASARETGRLSCTTSSRALAAPASRTIPIPSRNLPRAASWVTSSRRSSAASSRDAVDLCTSSSRATSVTPASPSRARISRITTARSTDWTDGAAPGPSCPLLLIAQRYPRINHSSRCRRHGRMGLMTVPAGVHDAFDLVEEQFNQALDESLGPSGPGVLYDYVAAIGLPPGSVALDAGCGEGEHAIDLSRRF